MKVKAENLDKVTKTFMMMPGIFTKARISALKSLGYNIMSEVRNHVEYGGTGWPGLHPLTRGFRKKYKMGEARWKKRSSAESPLFWLGKFSRYRVDDDGHVVQIDFGKSKKGQPGKVDPELAIVAKRAEQGETVIVTDEMRKFWAATRRRRLKNAKAGVEYHALKKSTHALKTPKRPIFAPVFKKMKAKVTPIFTEKFWNAIDRYQTGKKK